MSDQSKPSSDARDVERVTPFEGDRRDKGAQVSEMFDAIAPDYDLMNRAMTFGIDRLWRRKAVDMLRRSGPVKRCLDIATGTGDLAILLARRLTGCRVTGVDISEGMIEVGRRKVAEAGLADRITLGLADCLALPFADGEFDAITCAYGVRNFADLLGGLREMRRVLAPGGRLVIIELATPGSPIVRPFYNLYTRHIIPTVGRIVAGSGEAYTYLPASIAAVPQGERMEALMREAGFDKAATRRLTFGTCAIYYNF